MKSFTCQPEAVIFDLDGTLVDTADEFIRVVELMRRQRGLPPLPDELVRKSVSNGSGALVTLAVGSEPGTADHEQLRLEFLEHYERILGTSALPYQGMHTLVQQLHDAGIPWGVATNKFRRYAEPLMRAMNFQPPANSLVTPCDVSHAKPHPESILLSCHNVGAPPKNSLYIGDHKRDIEAGNAAGCFTIAASYGYIEDGDDPAQWAADALASSSEELADMIIRMIQ